MIDYLVTTGTYEMSLMGPLPLEAPSFKSLWLPYDNAVWIMTLALVALSVLVLSVVDILWGKTTNKTFSPIHTGLEGD